MVSGTESGGGLGEGEIWYCSRILRLNDGAMKVEEGRGTVIYLLKMGTVKIEL